MQGYKNEHVTPEPEFQDFICMLMFQVWHPPCAIEHERVYLTYAAWEVLSKCVLAALSNCHVTIAWTYASDIISWRLKAWKHNDNYTKQKSDQMNWAPISKIDKPDN